MASDWIRGDKINKTVILDSSALLSFFEFSVDWQNELGSLLGSYRLVVPTAVKRELQMLAAKHHGSKKAAAALRLIEQYETIDEEARSADDALVKIAERTKGIVVTNDTELRARLKTQGLHVIFLRGKKKLVLDE
jgi:rRNA-processing protein FCF1